MLFLVFLEIVFITTYIYPPRIFFNLFTDSLGTKLYLNSWYLQVRTILNILAKALLYQPCGRWIGKMVGDGCLAGYKGWADADTDADARYWEACVSSDGLI